MACLLKAVRIWEWSSWLSLLSKSSGWKVGLVTCCSVLHCSIEFMITFAFGLGVWYFESIALKLLVALPLASWRSSLMHHRTWWLSSWSLPHAKHLLSTELSIVFKCFFVGAHPCAYFNIWILHPGESELKAWLWIRQLMSLKVSSVHVSGISGSWHWDLAIM